MTITALIPNAPVLDAATFDDGPEKDAGIVLAAYARQVDELARLVEDWQAACAGYGRVLTDALGELHVVLDETATELARRTVRP